MLDETPPYPPEAGPMATEAGVPNPLPEPVVEGTPWLAMGRPKDVIVFLIDLIQ